MFVHQVPQKLVGVVCNDFFGQGWRLESWFFWNDSTTTTTTTTYVSLFSALLTAIQVQCVQVLHASLRRRNSERPRGSPPASEGLDYTSQALLFEVG